METTDKFCERLNNVNQTILLPFHMKASLQAEIVQRKAKMWVQRSKQLLAKWISDFNSI